MACESAIKLLEENPKDVFESISVLLLQVCDNIINYPEEIKFRRLRLSNKNVCDKLLLAVGAIECLFEIGFEEGDDSFVLPGSSPLKPVQQFRERLAQMIAKNNTKPPSPPEAVQSCSSSSIVPKTTSATKYRPPLIVPDENAKHCPFLRRIYDMSCRVLEYEDEDLQAKAKSCVPSAELWIAAQNRLRAEQMEKVNGVVDMEIQGLPDLFLIEVLEWFKNEFFSWVDRPECVICKLNTNFVGMSEKPIHHAEAPRTELYACSNGHLTPFHRYTDVEKLLDTRRGRCGEWAACFTLICRALSFDAREVFDETDHVWTEVWSVTQQRWLHCDSCEAICDAPLTYQVGWGKKLTYCIAYSRDDVQDVTWRYTQESLEDVIYRRNLCNESDLLNTLHCLRTQLQASASKPRKDFLQRRLLRELSELLRIPNRQRIVSEVETQGRQSGSVEWRSQRKELGNLSPCFIWEATPKELEAKVISLKFSAASNTYQRCDQSLHGWSRGIYGAQNINRKEERDWKKVYLARCEGCNEPGWIEWKFEIPCSGKLEMDNVILIVNSCTFNDAKVQWFVWGNIMKDPVPVPVGEKFKSKCIKGCTQLNLRAELSGGVGDLAWQHTQLFRQDVNDPSYPLEIEIFLSCKEE